MSGQSSLTVTNSGTLRRVMGFIGHSNISTGLSALTRLTKTLKGLVENRFSQNVKLGIKYSVTSISNVSFTVQNDLSIIMGLKALVQATTETIGNDVVFLYHYGVHTVLRIPTPTTKIGVDMKYKTNINTKNYKTILTVVIE